MVALRSSYSSSPTLRISDILASTRGPNVARSFALPLASQRGPQKAIRPFQSDFKLFGIPPLPFPLCQFSSVFETDDWFSLPMLKYFQSVAKGIGPLNSIPLKAFSIREKRRENGMFLFVKRKCTKYYQFLTS
ncbi:hypothetical protein AVEN_236651-1 [Araneus ventricosus]|uniref:Uncharacterized protein n=1 Tax=Araneus ventricosus TaxID=182803 RepID=A0A4Y2UYN8_ARAVE|nr:hypothetical protein AVEN_236651-1 [Araneus ventricosus]